MKVSFKMKLITVALLATNLSFAQNTTPKADAAEKVQITVPDTVAKVGDTTISKADYETLVQFLVKLGQPAPKDPAQAKQLVDSYARQIALIQKAKAAKIEQDADYILQKKFADNDMIINTYTAKLAKDIAVSDEEIKTTYDAEAKRLKDLPEAQRKQYKIANITTPNKKDADQAIKDLKAKKISFAAAAKKYSKDEAAERGGELGWIAGDSQIAPELLQVLQSLKPGLVPDPIKVGNNYLIINLEEVRIPSVLALDKIKDQLKDQLKAKKLQEQLKELAGTVAIENLMP